MDYLFLQSFRDPTLAQKIAAQCHEVVRGPCNIMEVCGGQTHAIMKYGIDQMLPAAVSLIHGPGCPVCVTGTSVIDLAIQIALKPNTILCSYGDMLRVPGSRGDLLSAKASGAQIRVVYSPLQALEIAKTNPEKEVVFFAIGFETTAPANAMAAYQAKKIGLTNFSLLVSQVLVPPALEAILSSPSHTVDALLAPGHVCTITGTSAYEDLAHRYNLPIVVTGFEPVDILQGVFMCLAQLKTGKALVENQYARFARSAGNREAQKMLAEVFETVAMEWRGMGLIPNSGLGLSPEYRDYDAKVRFCLSTPADETSATCISGEILRGQKKPPDCAEFGKKCRPESPLGATMVSAEGTCAAYYRYRL